MLIKLNLIPILFALFVLPFEALSQMWAVTERGDTIYVYDDGSWSFTKDAKPEAKGNQELDYLSIKLEIDTIQNPFNYTGSTDKEVRSKFDFFSIYYDQELWKRVPPGELNAEAEIAFKSIEKDIYAMVITEEINVGQENIVKIAINTMKKNTGGKVDIIKVEQRNINGTDFLRGVFRLDLQGLILIFDSYYHSSEQGTVQFTTWTGDNLWEKYQDQIGNLLNGIVVKNE